MAPSGYARFDSLALDADGHICVATLIHGAIVVDLLVEADDRTIDHFLGGSEGETAEDHGEGKEDLFHDGKG